MTRTMVPQAAGVVPVRRVLAALRPAVAAANQEHLHYDRGARVWRSHAELDRPAYPVEASVELDLQACA